MTSTSTSTLPNSQFIDHDAWRVASALNNMGVTLLERMSLRQAHQTLKDAIVVMRNASAPRREQSNDCGTIAEEMSLKLQRASQRVAQHMSPTGAISSSSTDPIPLLVGVDERLPRSLESFPIRIEPNEFDEINLNYLSSVICYNFALTYVYQSMSVKTQRKAGTLRIKAYDVLRLADRIIKLKRNQCMENLFISIQILSVMVWILVDMGKLKAAKVCAFKLTYLRNIQLELDSCDCHAGVQLTPSTAAAA